MNISELVDRARGTDEVAAVAAAHLVSAGTAALPTIIEAMKDPWSEPGKLSDVLISVYHDSDIGTVADGLGSQYFHIFHAALAALEMRADQQSKHILLAGLQNPHELPGRRADIAHVCGNLGDQEFVPVLQTVLGDSLSSPRAEDTPPTLSVEVAVALARLGDFSAGIHVVPLMDDDYAPTRALAAGAMKIAVGPGMISALTRNMEDPSSEVRNAAIDPLFLLGVPLAAKALMNGVENDDPDIQGGCLVRLNDILGTEYFDPDRSFSALESRLADALATWDEGTRYRAGHPFSISRLLEFIRPGNPRNSETVAEILLATGRHVDASDGVDAATRISLSAMFPREGSIYRWGHVVSADLFLRRP